MRNDCFLPYEDKKVFTLNTRDIAPFKLKTSTNQKSLEALY